MLLKLPDRKLTLVDDHNLPRYWATVWELFNGGQLAESTLGEKLRHIDALYRHTEASGGCLDDALAALDWDVLSSSLEAFFVCLRNTPSSGTRAVKRWNAAFRFVRDTCDRIASNPYAGNRMADIRSRVERLDRLYLGLRPHKKRLGGQPRALPRLVLTELLDATTPGSPNNPFPQERTQWRVYALVLLFLFQGLRRGEALTLKCDQLSPERDPRTNVYRWRLSVLSDEYEDVRRATRPSIKTIRSIRQNPVSAETAEGLLAYTENYRGRVGHGFLISSALGAPLSIEGVTKSMQKLSKALSNEARAELRARTGTGTVTAHALRHTCAVVRMKQLLSMGQSTEQAMTHLRSFFGWSRTSMMPLFYAKAALDETLNELWEDKLDARLDMLRSLPQ